VFVLVVLVVVLMGSVIDNKNPEVSGSGGRGILKRTLDGGYTPLIEESEACPAGAMTVDTLLDVSIMSAEGDSEIEVNVDDGAAEAETSDEATREEDDAASAGADEDKDKDDDEDEDEDVADAETDITGDVDGACATEGSSPGSRSLVFRKRLSFPRGGAENEDDNDDDDDTE
jgi:hypothetical protein